MRTRTTLLCLVTTAMIVAGCSSTETSTTGTSTTGTSTTGTSMSTSTSTTAGSDSIADAGFEVNAVESPYGMIIVDGGGNTLYAFLNDAPGTPSACTGACAEAWPPATAVDVVAGDDVDAAVLGVTDDGQVTVGGNRVYFFAGDGAPGESNGNGTGGVWFVVAPDGTPVQDKA